LSLPCRVRAAALLVLLHGLAPYAAVAASESDEGPKSPQLSQWFRMDAWRATRSASGDLNGDGHVDIAVILERTLEPGGRADPPLSARQLVILNSDKNGNWRRGAALDSLLPCGRCGDALSGVVESMIFDLTITDDNVMEIGWLQQRDNLAGVWLHIGWNAEAGTLALLGEQVTTAGRHYADHRLLRRDYRAGVEHRDGQQWTIEPRVIPLNDVAAADFGS
jgi:hypothetical protein